MMLFETARMDVPSWEEELAARGQEEEVVAYVSETSLDRPQGKRKSGDPVEPDFEGIKKARAESAAQLAGQIVQAARTGDFDSMKNLVDQGANIDDKICGCTSLMYSAFYGRDEMAEFLLKLGAKVDERNLSGQTALIWAIERQHLSIVKLLLSYHALPDVSDKKGLSAIHKAARAGNLDIIKALKEEGNADVNIEASQENDCCSVLQDAAFYGHQSIVQYLLENGANVDQKNSQGRTALHRAVYKNHSSIVQLLLDCGADIDVQDNNGRTAIHWAAFFGHLESFRVLLDNGSDIFIQDKAGMTPEVIARNRRHKVIYVTLSPHQQTETDL